MTLPLTKFCFIFKHLDRMLFVCFFRHICKIRSEHQRHTWLLTMNDSILTTFWYHLQSITEQKNATWNLFVTLMVHTHDYTFVIILQYNYACVAWCPLQFREKITSQALRWYCKAVYLLVLPVITVSFGNTY